MSDFVEPKSGKGYQNVLDFDFFVSRFHEFLNTVHNTKHYTNTLVHDMPSLIISNLFYGSQFITSQSFLLGVLDSISSICCKIY